jgi:hypothetical protein
MIGKMWQEVALLWPHFSCFVRHNRILAAPAVARRQGRLRFGSFQNPTWHAARSEAIAVEASAFEAAAIS